MNNYSISYKDITPADIESLLSELGWRHLKTFEGKSSVWESKTGEKYWAPLDMSFADYGDSIDALVALISTSEKIPETDAAAYIKQLYNMKDLVKLRVEADDVASGNIRFEDGENLFTSLKKIIASTIDDIPGIGRKIKDDFFKKSELSQTQIGSYVITAYLPLLDDSSSEDNIKITDLPDASVGRLINEAIFKRLMKLKSEITKFDSAQKNKLIENLMLEGFTLSECEAIESLFGKNGHRSWEIDFLWSHKINDKKSIRSQVRFEKATSTAVHEVTRGFKNVTSNPKAILQGRVTKLERDYDDHEGIIKLVTEINKKKSTVTVHVNDHQYQIAHSANENKKIVRMRGVLLTKKTGNRKTYVIPSLESIEIIQDDLFDSGKQKS